MLKEGNFDLEDVSRINWASVSDECDLQDALEVKPSSAGQSQIDYVQEDHGQVL
ncbi:hypothetical protein KIN20_032455 [Parelaphostrongylus tenuis]|uniref:Uncharacterized protein n=1 Tax=Parelaphostrongylus tenuis TaxID=148309 RepID=A0AAD5WHI3_PARTN|nr:hypothetical protein KIN20_032455 [Parelaphostrongylus tenuis]